MQMESRVRGSAWIIDSRESAQPGAACAWLARIATAWDAADGGRVQANSSLALRASSAAAWRRAWSTVRVLPCQKPPDSTPPVDRPVAEARPATKRLLPTLVARRPLDDAEDIGAVLISRVQHQTVKPRRGRRPAEARLVAGLIPMANGPMTDEITFALRERQELIETGAVALAEAAVERGEPWLKRLGSPPVEVGERERWLREVRTAAAYRDRYRRRRPHGARRRPAHRPAEAGRSPGRAGDTSRSCDIRGSVGTGAGVSRDRSKRSVDPVAGRPQPEFEPPPPQEGPLDRPACRRPGVLVE